MYVFGPVPSRRLGSSLGVDLVKPGYCSYSCVYCQLGRTKKLSVTRCPFFPVEEVLKELEARMEALGEEGRLPDHISLVGDGEPTLNSDIGRVLGMIQERWKTPTTVITNGSLLFQKDVRKELSQADIVLPSLDAGTPKTFRKLNRPHPSLEFRDMVSGLVHFREEFSGQLWLEFMVVPGLNDTREELEALRDILDTVQADRLYMNVSVRPPAEPWVTLPEQENLERIRELLGGGRSLQMPETGRFHLSGTKKGSQEQVPELLEVLERHPMSLEQVEEALEAWSVTDPEQIITALKEREDIDIVRYRGKEFFMVKGARGPRGRRLPPKEVLK